MRKIFKLLLFLFFVFLYFNVFCREISLDGQNILVTGSGMKTDAVHLPLKGAQLFADVLSKEMLKFLFDKTQLFQISN